MASTIRTIEFSDGEAFLASYDGTDGVAVLRVSTGLQAVSIEMDGLGIEQLISALRDIAATLPGDEPEITEPAPTVTYLMQTNDEDGRDYDWYDDEDEALEMAEIHSEGIMYQVDVFRQENWEGGKRTLIASFDDGRRIK